MRWKAGLVAAALSLAFLPGRAEALPVSTDGLAVLSATLQVQAVSAPSSWLPASTVYEGSPARLVLSVDAPGSGVVRTIVSLPGVTEAVGDFVADVSRGAATVTVPLDLSYGAWLAGAVRNTADHLDVSVTYTPSPSAHASAAQAVSPPTVPSVTEPAPQSPSKDSEALSVPPGPTAVPRPVRLVMTGMPDDDRRAIRAALRALPPTAVVVALVRPSASRATACPTSKRLSELVMSVARSSGRSVVVRRGEPVRQGCARLELKPSNGPTTRSVRSGAAATFTVPIVMAPRPVILVHGMWSTASIWDDYTRSGNLLVTDNPEWRGYAVSTMDTGSVWTPYADVNTIAQNAALAWTYIQGKMSDLNAHEVDIVGHSMGGVITRRMLHDPTNGAVARAAIRSVVLLGTPNGGSSCSEAWAVPANAELTHAAMATFNLAYPGYPGAFTTSLYADHFGSTCFDANAGDMFVPAWSTQAQEVNVVQRISPGVQHADMPMDSRVFSDYVKPALARASAPGPAGPTTALTNPHASSTRLDEGTATGATLSVTRSVTITSGQRLVASVVAAMGATGTLTYPGGTVSLSQVADYPVFEGEASYATLGGTGGPVTVTVTIDATTTATAPEWRWSLVSRS